MTSDSPSSPTWTFTDGWILMSVFAAHGQDGAPLKQLIAAADGMNHAIPTTTELSTALTRLASCGILSEHTGRFRIAGEYLPLIATALKGRGGLFSTPEKGRKWLKRMKFEARSSSIHVSITDEQIAEACNRYREDFVQNAPLHIRRLLARDSDSDPDRSEKQ